jgi:predicted ATPase
MRGAIAWSVELLDAADQGLFARLGVFVGGCTPHAATAVCSATPAALDALVDASLLRATLEGGAQRYTMLETVREYAVELLADSSERGDVERRHVEWLIELALEAQSHARGPEEKPWLDRLARELDEIRAALSRSLEDDGDRRLGLALAAALEAFWTRRAIAREGVRWLEAFLPYRDAAPPAVAAGALASAARLALDLGEAERARPWATEAERIARAE